MIDTISRSKQADLFGNQSLPAIANVRDHYRDDGRVSYEREKIRNPAARKRSEEGNR